MNPLSFPNPSRVPFPRTLALGLATAVAVLLSAASAALAQPTGGIEGTIVFSGIDAPPYPSVRIRIVSTLQPEVIAADFYTPHSSPRFRVEGLATDTYDVELTASCWEGGGRGQVDVTDQMVDLGDLDMSPAASAYTTIKFVGDFNGWDLSTPSMSKVALTTWADTLDLAPDTYNCKFVTDGAYDDPPDYGGDQTVTLDIPGSDITVLPVTNGDETALSLRALVAGKYAFILDESRQVLSVALVGSGPEGVISGSLAFAGLNQAPYPPAVVDLYDASTQPATQYRTVLSDPADGSFRFDTVPDGSYEIQVSTPCFASVSRTGITVAGGEVALGTIALDAAGSDFSRIQLAGSFTDPQWDLGLAPDLVQDPDCVWTVSLDVADPGLVTFKFVTDGAYDGDYGGNEAAVLSAPGTFPVTAGVSGEGTGLKVEFPAAGSWIIKLDERRQDFTVTRATPVRATTWGRLKQAYR